MGYQLSTSGHTLQDITKVLQDSAHLVFLRQFVLCIFLPFQEVYGSIFLDISYHNMFDLSSLFYICYQFSKMLFMRVLQRLILEHQKAFLFQQLRMCQAKKITEPLDTCKYPNVFVISHGLLETISSSCWVCHQHAGNIQEVKY